MWHLYIFPGSYDEKALKGTVRWRWQAKRWMRENRHRGAERRAINLQTGAHIVDTSHGVTPLQVLLENGDPEAFQYMPPHKSKPTSPAMLEEILAVVMIGLAIAVVILHFRHGWPF